MSYPDYTREERIADYIVHVVGVCAALTATVFLLSLGSDGLRPGTYIAALVYTTGMILMLSASAAYHMGAHTQARPWLRRIDHAAIYIKIAATLTPLAVLLGTRAGYLVLAVIWALALAGALSKLRAARGKMSVGWMPQVGLGWLGILLIVPLWSDLPHNSVALILAGGLIYTGAVVFYCWENLKYCNALWHVCVLVATACCFLGISTALTHKGAAEAAQPVTEALP
ncbi:MAG: hemolysin III family protein [Pseudomonadota bacterium]